MLFPTSYRCSVGGKTIRLSSQSSRVGYSAPLFFFYRFFLFLVFFSFFSPWEVVSYVCMFLFFFATHHPPVITTCSWGSVGHFRPWTHTSDDSYIYQLSLVVATATVSYQVLTGIPRRHSPLVVSSFLKLYNMYVVYDVSLQHNFSYFRRILVLSEH